MMTTKTIQILLFLALSNSVFAQHDVADSTKQNEATISGYNKQKALTDIKTGTLKIILPGGIVSAAELSGDELSRKSTESISFLKVA